MRGWPLAGALLSLMALGCERPPEATEERTEPPVEAAPAGPVDLGELVPEALRALPWGQPLDEAAWRALCQEKAMELDIGGIPPTARRWVECRRIAPAAEPDEGWQLPAEPGQWALGRLGSTEFQDQEEIPFPFSLENGQASIFLPALEPEDAVGIWLEKHGERGLVPCGPFETTLLCLPPGVRNTTRMEARDLQETFELHHAGELGGQPVEVEVLFTTHGEERGGRHLRGTVVSVSVSAVGERMERAKAAEEQARTVF